MSENDVLTRWISCDRKIKYGHEATANRAVRVMEMKRRFGDRRKLESYKCQYCDGWHIGHRKLAGGTSSSTG